MNQKNEQSPRSDIYLLLATLFRQAPTSDILKWLASLPIEDSQSQMRPAWQAITQAAAKESIESLESEYQNLFIGIGRGEVMPFGSWHQSGSLMDKPLIALRQDLRELGFEREAMVKEPEDHIAALCEVMAMLISDNAHQQGTFFSRHIATWYDDFVTQIQQAESAQFYIHVANLLKSFFELEQVALSEQKIAVHSS